MSGRVQGVLVEAAITAGAAGTAIQIVVTAADTEATPGAAHLNRF